MRQTRGLAAVAAALVLPVACSLLQWDFTMTNDIVEQTLDYGGSPPPSFTPPVEEAFPHTFDQDTDLHENAKLYIEALSLTLTGTVTDFDWLESAVIVVYPESTPASRTNIAEILVVPAGAATLDFTVDSTIDFGPIMRDDPLGYTFELTLTVKSDPGGAVTFDGEVRLSGSVQL